MKDSSDSIIEIFESTPSDWSIRKLDFLSAKGKYSFVDGPFGSDLKNEEYTDFGIPLIQLNNIGVGNHSLDKLNFVSEEKADSLIKHNAYKNEIVIAKMADPVARATIISNQFDRYVIVADCIKLNPNSDLVDLRFLVYTINSQPVRTQAEMISTGTTRIRINLTSLKKLKVFYPPLKTQKQIADFLDKETTRIDNLISLKQKQIELLQEKRQAIITQAVTKGLDPTVKMKDSGVEWIGEIPEHWRIIRLKHVSSSIVDCPHSTPVYSEDGEFPAIRTADIVRGKISIENTRMVAEDVYLERIQRLKPVYGDIIYSREGERFGMAGEVPQGSSVCLAQRIMMFRIQKKYSNRFFMWSLNSDSTYNQAKQDTFGSTSPHVNVETIKNFNLPSPSYEEQTKICEWIDKETERTDSTILIVNKSINLLKEYRSSLITHAVSGQIDINAYEASHE